MKCRGLARRAAAVGPANPRNSKGRHDRLRAASMATATVVRNRDALEPRDGQGTVESRACMQLLVTK